MYPSTHTDEKMSDHDETIESMQSVKKERSTIKGQITKVKSTIDGLPKDAENIENIKSKLSTLPVLINKFEEIHRKLLIHMTTEEDKEEAAKYRADLISDTETYEQGIMTWMAGLETEIDDVSIAKPPTTDDVIMESTESRLPTLEIEHDAAAKTLNDLSRQKQLEEEVFKMKVQAQKMQKELQQIRLARLESEVESQRAMKKMYERRRKLEAELKELATDENEEPSNPLSSTESTPSAHFLSCAKSSVNTQQPATAPMTSTFGESVHSVERMMKTILDESRAQQQTIVETLQLPKRELQCFNGNPLKYWSFIRSFQACVGRKSIDVASKLSCLLQYCTGQARDVLECIEMMDPEEGYEKALQILESRFGNRHNITQQWVTKITDRPDVKGEADLRKYADDLKCCESMLINMGHVHELDNSFTLKIIWRKLPQYLRDRWSHKNFEFVKQGKKCGLKQLVEFITEAAEEAMDPVFSRLSCSESKDDGKKSVLQPRTCFATTATISSINDKGTCPCCDQEGHYITKCTQFKALRVRERRDLVIRKRLCMNCYARGHLCRDCPQSFVCQVDGCGLKHSIFLHLGSRPRQEHAQQGYTATTEQVQRAPAFFLPSLSESEQVLNKKEHVFKFHD